MEIKPIFTASQIEATAKLGAEIWEEHYTPIIGTAQVAYMLDKYQSAHAILRQIEHEGYHYYGLEESDKLLGYLAVQKRNDELFLSKIYVHKSARGKGYGKIALKFVEDFAKKHSCTAITLTVNKHNSGSIEAYKKMGFYIDAEEVADIGKGYVMDDYIMKKIV